MKKAESPLVGGHPRQLRRLYSTRAPNSLRTRGFLPLAHSEFGFTESFPLGSLVPVRVTGDLSSILSSPSVNLIARTPCVMIPTIRSELKPATNGSQIWVVPAIEHEVGKPSRHRSDE